MSINLPTRRLVSQNDSSIIENANVPRSRFLGRWTRKTAFTAGRLIPFLVEEILPGDHMRYNVTAFVRISTTLFPIFDNQRIDTFFFFIPNRLVWANWAKFMGEQANPDSSIAYNLPTMTYDDESFNPGSLYDHMGLPVAGQLAPGQDITFQSLPIRAYALVWNTWFRDQNVQNSTTVDTDDGPDDPDAYGLLFRGKSHDYFTTALPWPQKFTAPTVPIAGQAPITGIGVIDDVSSLGGTNYYETGDTPGSPGLFDFSVNSSHYATNPIGVRMTAADPGVPAIYADLTQATGVAINQLRQAWMIQSLLERDARGGTRYVELIRSHFGVTNPDFRLQRPEYIGGGQTPLSITPIAQTAPTEDAPLGALGGAGTAAGSHHASYAATEHGIILGLINVRSEISYQQGIHRMWTRTTRTDFYWPSLAMMGEQAILRKEIYADGNPADEDTVFGYQARYEEYRQRYSEVVGLMRSTATGTLDAWHLAQEFESAPVLSTEFIQDNPPMSRVLAGGTEAVPQTYLADIVIERQAVRPIPLYGTPATLGRF